MPNEQEQRHVYYDRDLKIEAYNLSGIVQKFPNHFHDYYVIGFVEGGCRHLCCKSKEYDVTAGDLILFNPHDNHYCAPLGGEILDYRAVNVTQDVMERAAFDITGTSFIPHFTQNVVYKSDIAQSLGRLYDAILTGSPRMEREEAFFFLIHQVLQDYAAPFDEAGISQPDPQIQKLCRYMDDHFSENITLNDLLTMTSFGKSYLMISFTRQVGVSPYRYLQTVRLDRARKFLEQGISPIDASDMAGFSDQSHFTNFFRNFTGLTPKQYQRIFSNNSGGTSTEVLLEKPGDDKRKEQNKS